MQGHESSAANPHTKATSSALGTKIPNVMQLQGTINMSLLHLIVFPA